MLDARMPTFRAAGLNLQKCKISRSSGVFPPFLLLDLVGFCSSAERTVGKSVICLNGFLVFAKFYTFSRDNFGTKAQPQNGFGLEGAALSAAAGGRIKVVDLATEPPGTRVTIACRSPALAVAVLPGDKRLAAGTSDGRVCHGGRPPSPPNERRVGAAPDL